MDVAADILQFGDSTDAAMQEIAVCPLCIRKKMAVSVARDIATGQDI